MKLSHLIFPASASLLVLAGAVSCEDNVSQIGDSITKGEVTIHIDSIDYDLKASPVANNDFDSRSGMLMLGNIDVPEYGRLNCSFVTRLLSVAALPQADTVSLDRIDSCKLQLGIARYNYTGDNLSPQKISVFKLNKQIPNDISNDFDPEGYYDARAIGKKSFTLNLLQDTSMFVYVDLPVELGRELFTEYKKSPASFQWPQNFAKYFPGLFVKSTFGKGCVSNITLLNLKTYFHTPDVKTETVDGTSTTVKYNRPDSVTVLTAAPEVLSSNNISYTVSEKIQKRIDDGETIITTPGGYVSRFTFPVEKIIDDYKDKDFNLSIISSLVMNVPAVPVENDLNISVAPYMLMIKTSEIDNFFSNDKIPDNKIAFSAAYDATNKRYSFNSLRTYLLDLLEKGTVKPDDVDFSFIPVYLGSESTDPTWFQQSTSYVVSCIPYIMAPTMTLLDTKNTEIVFTFSSQVVD